MADEDESDVLLAASEDEKLDWYIRDVYGWRTTQLAELLANDQSSSAWQTGGGAIVQYGSNGISDNNGQGKQSLHRSTQGKHRGTWRIQSGTTAQGDALGYVQKFGQTRVVQPVQDVHREAQRKETKLIICAHKGRRDGAMITRKVMYFAAHPNGGAGHLDEKVQALLCRGAYTSVGSGVAR
ncbi:hypothetical protein Acr_21g0003470 [Actinidia rufa]|uniref:Uncharacterized protein n=1 Tax=Actinidia rufa TaxID=165716 RepID=A0A7J0GGB2_9ERIC|nr:hypothetical protein Acr_21g0003470 [Actinidia rufa]